MTFPFTRRLLGPALALLALLPTLTVGFQALQTGESQAARRRQSERKRVLQALVRDPTVLINVKYRDMPSSPDILNWGKRSTKALERCLADNVDANNRSLCAVTLHALGDRAALPTLQAALEDWNDNVRYEVVRALGSIVDVGSVAPLIKLYRRNDEASHVRVQVLRTMGNISDQRVVRLLRSELKKKRDDGEKFFAVHAFNALWNNRHLMARTTLINDLRYALKSDHTPLVLAATFAAAEVRAPQLGGSLVPLMDHENDEVRNKAVYALGRIGDAKATRALLARLPLVRQSRMLNNIAFALERLDQKAFHRSIKQLVEHKQAVIRLNAAFVLGDVKHPAGLPMLVNALKDANDFVRTSALAAIGKIAVTEPAQRQSALKALASFTAHGNLSLREEAIYATHGLTESGRTDLLYDKLFKLDKRDHKYMVRRAGIALAQAGDLRVRRWAVDCLLSYACDEDDVGDYVGAKADDTIKGRILLAWVRGQHRLTPLLAELRPSGTLPIARSSLLESWDSPRSSATHNALRILGGLKTPSLVPLLLQRTKTKITWPRVRALVAAARLGAPSAAPRLMNELANVPAEDLGSFANMLSEVAEGPARATLTPLLMQREKSPDVSIAMAAAAIRLSWDPDKAFFRLFEALASTSSYERELAARYLKKNRSQRVTWLIRRALAREDRPSTRDRLRTMLDQRG